MSTVYGRPPITIVSKSPVPLPGYLQPEVDDKHHGDCDAPRLLCNRRCLTTMVSSRVQGHLKGLDSSTHRGAQVAWMVHQRVRILSFHRHPPSATSYLSQIPGWLPSLVAPIIANFPARELGPLQVTKSGNGFLSLSSPAHRRHCAPTPDDSERLPNIICVTAMCLPRPLAPHYRMLVIEH